MIDPTLRNFNRFFVESFKFGKIDSTRNYSFKNDMPLVQIKDFNTLIGNKSFFNQPVKKIKCI